MTITHESVAAKPPRRSNAVVETLKVVVPALLIALLVRTFLFQSYSIPSGSMQNTLEVGDYVLVSKFSYGYSRYSLPFDLNLFPGRIFAAQPQRGDIVVFRLPSDPSVDYVKRLIGLPGDHVQMIGGQLYLNGQPVARERLGVTRTRGYFGNDVAATRWRETLPNGVSYETLDLQPNNELDDTREFVVPDGHYFMMGDNRDDSADSRVASAPGSPGVGFVPFENIVGKAQVIFFSIRDASPWQVWRWPEAIRWDRLFRAP